MTVRGDVKLAYVSGAKPFVKWAGGKSQLLDELVPRVPDSYGTYYEPFVGGGALFFALSPTRAVLSDMNEELVNVYVVLRDSVEEVIDLLKTYPMDKDFYYRLRAVEPSELSPVQRACRFIYLNKTCYNGLYRVNSKGRFNVPYGRYRNRTICDEVGLRQASRTLKGVTIMAADFEESVRSATGGDFVYFDPPYHPLSESSNFTGYIPDGFGDVEQSRLARVARELSARGVYVMISNSDTEFVRSLYAGFRIERVWARRSINCKQDRRGPVSELIITNY